MPALAQLRIDALLAVLLVTACVMLSLRSWSTWCKRAVKARDARLIRAVDEARHREAGDVPQ
jgi:hypothetical protein